MKYFNKILLSAISVIAIANCTSYSMDNPVRHKNNNNITNNQCNNYNLTMQDKIKISNNINDILIYMNDYSDNSLIVNKYYLNNRKIALQNQITRIEKINIPVIEKLVTRCLENHDNYTSTLTSISNNDISINNLKDRMKIVEEKLGIQYNTNNIENNINDIKNEKIVNIINNNYSTKIADICISPVYKSINNSLYKYKIDGKIDFFLSGFIEYGRKSFDKFKSNIDENNLLIEEIKGIGENLYNNYQQLYLKTYHLKEFINLVENELKKLNNKTKEHTEKMEDLKKRFYKITKKLEEKKIKDVENEKRKYICGLACNDLKKEMIDKNIDLKDDGTLKQTNKLDTMMKITKETVLNGEKLIRKKIFELEENYKFGYKDYIIKILNDMKSMLFETSSISRKNDKILTKEINNVEQLTHYENILLLDKKVNNVDDGVIKNLNKVANYSLSIRKIQENLCSIEDKLGIKSTISQKYDKIEKEKFGLQLENTDLKRKNKNLIDRNKKLHVKNQELYNMLNINEQKNNMDLFSPSSPNMFKNDTEIEKDENNKYLDKNMSIQNKKNEGNNTSSIDSDDSSSESNKTLNKKRNRQDDQNVENKDNIKNNRNEKSKNKNISNKNKKVIEDSDSEQ